jgi:hypothetical protein
LNRSLFTIVAEPYKPVDEILIIIYNITVYIIFYLKLQIKKIKMLLTMVFFGGFFWDRLNAHQCSYVTRTDRRVEGLVAEEWVDGWVDGWAEEWVEGEGKGGV